MGGIDRNGGGDAGYCRIICYGSRDNRKEKVDKRLKI